MLLDQLESKFISKTIVVYIYSIQIQNIFINSKNIYIKEIMKNVPTLTCTRTMNYVFLLPLL
jgi:hypothetical protein